jgi:Right handed beta helix region
MTRILLMISIVTFVGSGALGQSADLGAQIAAEDARLGEEPGRIRITTSGTISEGKVALSPGHDLICDDQVVIFLNAGSYLYQDSNTRIANCIISSTSSPIAGEIQSVNTKHLALDKVTFVGGGNLVYWSGVTGFRISDNNIVSITAVDAETQSPRSGYYLLNCSQGLIDSLTSTGFVFPAGRMFPGIVVLNLSNHITITNPMIHDVDASYVRAGGAVIEVNGSTNIDINGGSITNNANMDGVLSESYGTKIASSYLAISDLNASYNGALGLNKDAPLALGDGIDIINTSHVRISHCIVNGNGNNVHDQQPGIWFFLDDDVEVADSDVSENSASGVSAAGSRNVRIVRDTINRNQASGVFAEWQGARVTNVGPEVTFETGPTGGFGVDWLPGTPITLDGVTYQLASITDSGHLTLTTSPPDHSSPVGVGIDTTQDISDTIINDNGMGKWSGTVGEQYQVGISWADGTTGTISGVTSGNTGIGQQLYALALVNTASATLNNDNFPANLLAVDGIDASRQTVSAPSLSFPNLLVGSTSSAQTLTLKAGAIVLQNLIIQTGGDFSQTNSCGSSLAAFATCQIQITFTPSTVGALGGALTIADSAPHNPPTISLTGTGAAAGLGLSIATGSSHSVTVTAGTIATYMLSIGGFGMAGVASMSCSGVPSDATCSLPTTQSVSASQATVFAVRVATSAPTVGILRPLDLWHGPVLWALTILTGITLTAKAKAKQRVGRYRVGPLLFLVILCSCGGEGSRGTRPGNYNLTVSAKVGSASQKIQLLLTVR